MQHLNTMDPEIKGWIEKELARQRDGLEMIPSENFTSLAVMEAMGSILTNKYSEGYPGKRYYGGNQFIDEVENLARDRAKKLFGVEHANVQPYSGSPANQAVCFALLNPGDTILGMELAQGGHLTHGYKVNFSGKYYRAVNYGVDPKTHLLDYEAIRAIAIKEKPKLIICGATAYPRQIDFAKFSAIAHEVNAYLLADISHISGLVISGVHQSPVPYADVIMTTTHKTLRGPRGAMIMCKEKIAKEIDKSVFPGFQGGPHENNIAAKAIAFKEALEPAYKEYARQIKVNAKVLEKKFNEFGYKLMFGGTDNHMLLIDVTPKGLSGKEAQIALDKAGITVNKNMIPDDPRSPMDPSGIRLGTPALTTRGFKEVEMELVGNWINEAIENWKDDAKLAEIKNKVLELTKKFPLYPELQ